MPVSGSISWMFDPSALVFAEPARLWLAALAILPWIYGHLALHGEHPRTPHVDFSATKALSGVPGSWRSRFAFVPSLLVTLAILALSLAIARPRERVVTTDETRGIDILLCIDASSSMAARDMSPTRTRLDLAKTSALRFIDGRPADAIGIVRFARFADLVCPTTRDHRALAKMLEQVQHVEADGPEDRTGIGSALALAAKTLRSSTSRSKVIVMLTDGEENVATTATPDEIGPLLAAELSREYGIRVYSIAAGIGKRSETGLLEPLDTTQLRGIAETTGGAFFEAKDDRAIDSVYDRIDELEKSIARTSDIELVDRNWPFVALALLLLALYHATRTTLWRTLP